MASSSSAAPHIERDEIIFDWNEIAPRPKPAHAFDLNDETLRDGVQSPSVVDPQGQRQAPAARADGTRIGVRAVDIGLPGAGKRAFDDVVRQAKYIARRRGCRSSPTARRAPWLADIKPVVEAAQRSGQKIVVYTFIGSSPIRQWAEGWDLDFIRKTSEEAISFAVSEGLEVRLRHRGHHPHARRRASTCSFAARSTQGASRLVLCDTVGHATPEGARALVEWTKGLINASGARVAIDWHGHNDRGLAVQNAIAALEAGAQRIHACGLGVGERVGNTSMDQLLLNLKLMGWIDYDLHHLVEYVQKVSQATKVAVPVNYPLSGHDAFRTATGVHAAAIIKAKSKGDDWLADRVYSGVPAGEFGKEQLIEIGHMSGMSNVRYWLAQRKLPTSDEMCQRILQKAKSVSWTLSEKEVLALVGLSKAARPAKAPKPAKGKRGGAKPRRSAAARKGSRRRAAR